MRSTYSTRDVAKLLGLSEPQVRSQARAGFLAPERGPHNGFRFSFQDLVLLRTARELAQARVPPRRLRSALKSLARRLPAGHSLSELRISAEGEQVVVHDQEGAWNPESGQLQLVFAARRPSPAVSVTSRLGVSKLDPSRPFGAQDWFDYGVNLEAIAPDQAERAYSQALAMDPDFSAAHVNLGRLLQLAGRSAEAVEHYRRSLEAVGSDPIAMFNLGTALEEVAQWPEAIAAYRRAIRADPTFADAHFNLARLYERAGRRAAATRHWREYQRLVRGLSKDV